jgi:Domain of unknown function (DUF2017)
MDAFRRSGRGVRARFDGPEAVLLRSLIEQVVELLAGPGDAADPADRMAEPPAPVADDRDGPGGAGRPGQPATPSAAELEAMVGFGGSGTGDADGLADTDTGIPEDPALARLLPDAYRDDAEAAGEFRRFTEHSLRTAKQENARIVLDTLPAGGGSVKLSGEQAQCWLRTLNDVRLALGVRLEVTEEFEQQWQDLDPVDPRTAAFEVYAWLGGVQESLVQALS